MLCSKVMEPVGAGPNERGLSRRHILNQVEASLRRLGTDHLDLYYAHHPDPATPLEQTLRAFDDLVSQGKIRYARAFDLSGLADDGGAVDRRSMRFRAAGLQPDRLQPGQPRAEQEVLPACRQFGVGVTVFSPLAGGLLAGPAVRRRPVAGGLRWGASGFSSRQVRWPSGWRSWPARAATRPPCWRSPGWSRAPASAPR